MISLRLSAYCAVNNGPEPFTPNRDDGNGMNGDSWRCFHDLLLGCRDYHLRHAILFPALCLFLVGAFTEVDCGGESQSRLLADPGSSGTWGKIAAIIGQMQCLFCAFSRCNQPGILGFLDGGSLV
jgi:hypothetical protein